MEGATTEAMQSCEVGGEVARGHPRAHQGAPRAPPTAIGLVPGTCRRRGVAQRYLPVTCSPPLWAEQAVTSTPARPPTFAPTKSLRLVTLTTTNNDVVRCLTLCFTLPHWRGKGLLGFPCPPVPASAPQPPYTAQPATPLLPHAKRDSQYPYPPLEFLTLSRNSTASPLKARAKCLGATKWTDIQAWLKV